MNKLFLVRHGENTANITKEFSYKNIDYSLTEKGKLQAYQTAEYFNNIHIDYIYSSPLKRALETSEIISKRKNLPFAVIENFREVNIGKLEGMNSNKTAWEIFNRITKEWLIGKNEISFPDGESLNDLVERFKIGLIEVNRNNNNKTILVVGHAGIFTNGIIELLNLTDKQAFYDQKNHNCSISDFDIEIKDSKISVLKLINWASVKHISGDAALFAHGMIDE